MADDTSTLKIVIDGTEAIPVAEKVSDSIDDITDSGDEATDTMKRMKKETKDLVKGLKTLAIASAAALVAFTASTVKSTLELKDMAENIGLTTEELSTYEFVAGKVRISTDTMRDALIDMNEKIGEARIGSGTLNDVFADTNPIMLERIKNTKSTSEAFEILLGVLRDTENVQDRTILSTELFADAGKDLVRVANLGADGLEDLKNKAEDMGAVITTQTAKDMEVFSGNLDAVKGQLINASRVIVEGFIPSLNAISGEMGGNSELFKEYEEGFHNIGVTLGNTAQIAKFTVDALGAAVASIALGFNPEEGALTAIADELTLSFEFLIANTQEYGLENKKTAEAVSVTTDELKKTLTELEKMRAAVVAAELAQRELVKSEADHAKSLQTLQDQFTSLEESVNSSLKAEREMEEVLRILDEAVVSLNLSTEDRQVILERYIKTTLDADSATEKFGDTAEKTATIFEENSEKIIGGIGGIANELGGTFLSDSEDKWADYATFVIEQIGRIITELIVLKAIESGASALAGGVSGTKSGAKIAVASATKIVPFANGTVIDSPTTFSMGGGKTGLMGEAGAEAIMPLSRSSDGSLGVKMQGGGGGSTAIDARTYLTVEGNADDSTVQQLQQLLPQLQKGIENSILTKIARGGAFSKAVGARR